MSGGGRRGACELGPPPAPEEVAARPGLLYPAKQSPGWTAEKQENGLPAAVGNVPEFTACWRETASRELNSARPGIWSASLTVVSPVPGIVPDTLEVHKVCSMHEGSLKSPRKGQHSRKGSAPASLSVQTPPQPLRVPSVEDAVNRCPSSAAHGSRTPVSGMRWPSRCVQEVSGRCGQGHPLWHLLQRAWQMDLHSLFQIGRDTWLPGLPSKERPPLVWASGGGGGGRCWMPVDSPRGVDVDRASSSDFRPHTLSVFSASLSHL